MSLNYEYLKDRDFDKVEELLKQGMTVDEIIKWDLALKVKCEPKRGVLEYVSDEPINFDRQITLKRSNGHGVIVSKKTYDFLTARTKPKLNDRA